MSTYKLRLVPSRKVRLLTQSTLDNEKNTEIQQEKFGDRKFHKPQPQPPQGPVPTPAFTTTKHLSQCKNQDHHLAEESKDQGQVNLPPEELDLFIYLGFYVAFNTVQVISRRVVGRAEETST